MKKILVLIMCLLFLCSMSITVFAAEGEIADEVITEAVEEENSTTEDESATEGEILPPTETPEVTPEESKLDWDTLSSKVVNWLFEHYDKVLVSVFLLISAIWEKSRDKKLNKSMGTLNNNAVTIAEKSTGFMSQALTNIENASGAVTNYDARIVALLEAFKNTAEDKARLERELVEIRSYLQTSSKANIEFANELADLLALANIPNYKKEELGSRHLAAVNAIIEAEAKAEALLPTTTEEVKKDVGEEA